jgi:hypothetical protein
MRIGRAAALAACVPVLVFAASAAAGGAGLEVPAELVAKWDARLLAGVRRALDDGRRPSFRVSGLRATVRVVSAGEGGSLEISASGLTTRYGLSRLPIADRRSLALAVLADGDAEGHAVAAFYLLASGADGEADPHLARAGSFADELRTAFPEREPPRKKPLKERKPAAGREAKGPSDSPQWRGGPSRTGAVEGGPRLAGAWPAGGPPLVWETETFLPDKSSFGLVSVAGGRAYVSYCDRKTSENVTVCFDAGTGRQLWRAAFPGSLSSKYGSTGTPAVWGGRVYTTMTAGMLYCLDAGTGALVWQKKMQKLEMWRTMYTSPLVVDGVVVVHGQSAVAAYDAATGRELWEQTKIGAVAFKHNWSFSSPTAWRHNGTPYVLIHSTVCEAISVPGLEIDAAEVARRKEQRGPRFTHAFCLDLRTGEILWAAHTVPMTTPYEADGTIAVSGDVMVVPSSREVGASRITPEGATKLWSVPVK